MYSRGCSPARNDPLSFLSSHVSRSVSPTTTSQIQARKKRRGVSVFYDDQGSCVPWSGVPLCELGGCWPIFTVRTQCKITFTPLLQNSPQSQKICPQTWQKRGEQFPLGLSCPVLHSAFAPPKTFTPRALPKHLGGVLDLSAVPVSDCGFFCLLGKSPADHREAAPRPHQQQPLGAAAPGAHGL